MATAVAIGVTEALAADVRISATIDRPQLAVGESAVLSITVEGTQNAAPPDVGGIAGFQVQYQGPATQMSWVNGQMSVSVTHRYVLIAKQVGDFVLGPFEIASAGQTHHTAPLRVRVIPEPQPSERSSGGAARPGHPWLVILPGKKEAYVGERIPLTVKLYIGRTRVEQLQFPKIAGDGFMIDALPQPVERREIVGGVSYKVLVFDSNATPLRPGALTLGPATMEMVQLVSRRRDFFDTFFDDVFAERHPFVAQGEPVILNVLPLPEEGRPSDFNGAVGQFDFTLEARPTELAVGDPITVRMRISGSGNLAGVNAPRVPVDDRFRAYDPVPAKDEEGRGDRVFEQVLIPKEDSVTALPAVRFSFFDPALRSYRTVSRGPLALTVRAVPAGATPAAPQVVLSDQQTMPEPTPEKLGRDIVYIKSAPGRVFPLANHPMQSWGFALMQVVPVLGFVLVAAYVNRRERFRADPQLLRFRRAAGEARRALAALGREQDEGPQFYDGLTAAVLTYLAAKLALPPGALSRDEVCARLSRAGASAGLRERADSFFDIVERVRYAARNVTREEQADMLRLAREIVDLMEREKNLIKYLPTASSAAAILSCLLAASLTVAGEDAAKPASGTDPYAAFYAGNTAYNEERYQDAIVAYRSALEAGYASGALFFNLGNAYFKKGQLGEAVLNYERARRLLPRDPDVVSNLTYARELAQDKGWDVGLWWKLVFPLATRATTNELVWASTTLWWGLWVTLSVRLLVASRRATCTRAAIALGVTFVIVSASLVARLVTVEWNRAAVVTAHGTVAVRFEPSEAGTEYFQVGEGIVLEVDEERNGWLQVRRSDGRRGWLPAAAAGVI